MKTKQKWTKRQHEQRRFLIRLARAWRKLPGQRLGQLLCNARNNDLFYVEDETLLRFVERYVDQS